MQYANATQPMGYTEKVAPSQMMPGMPGPRPATATESLLHELRETLAVMAQAQAHLNVVGERLFPPSPEQPCGRGETCGPSWMVGALLDVAQQLRDQALSLRSSAESLNERL